MLEEEGRKGTEEDVECKRDGRERERRRRKKDGSAVYIENREW